MKISALFLTALLPLATLGAAAQDVPSRAGRLAYIEGEAAVYQDPELGWDRAYVNTPITSENSVWTGERSRAEVRVSGIGIRMDQLTQLDVARLDDNDINAFVPRGSVGVRVRHFANNTRFDLATPQGQFRLFGEGAYRLDVDPERDETLLTVFQGAAALRSASGDVNVNAGNAVRITGGPSPAYYYERVATGDFDRWMQARDAHWVEQRSVSYVSPYMTGYEDLDAYGQWSRDAELGAVWFPTRVASDWAPYRYGHWAYVRPWGYTWVDDAPWGYAPFHYGRWAYVRNRWGWIPGDRVARPAWAPALVAWVGGNVSVRIGVGGPAVGWYPLSPWDNYDPWFRAPSSYASRVNLIVGNYNRRGNDRDRREWHDRTRERGSTVVNREQFQAGRAVAPSRIAVTPEVARQLPQANPTQVLPSRTEVVQRRAQVRSSQPQVAAPPPAPAASPAGTMPGRPTVGGAPSSAPQAVNPAGRGTGNAPVFARPQAAPAPQAAPGRGPQPQAAQRPQGGVPAQAAPAQGTPAQAAPTPQPPQANSRQNREAQQAQERARREAEEVAARQRLLEGQGQDAQKAQQREQQLEQQRQQREAQQVQERQQRGSQQAQERAQQEAQRQQQEAQRQQREAQLVQERQAREAKQAQERQQQEAQSRQQALERQKREAQQAQERQQRDAQQAQQRAQQQAQEKQQRDAQQAQQKAQQLEAQRQQQLQQRAQPPQAQPVQPVKPPQAAQPVPPAQPQNQGQGKGRGQAPKDKDDEDKDKKK